MRMPVMPFSSQKSRTAVGGAALHAVAQKAVVGGAVTEFFQQLRFVQLQYFRKALRGKAELFLRHLARGGPQCPAAAVGGKQYTVGAVDTAPVGRHHSIAQLLAEGAVRYTSRPQTAADTPAARQAPQSRRSTSTRPPAVPGHGMPVPAGCARDAAPVLAWQAPPSLGKCMRRCAGGYD